MESYSAVSFSTPGTPVIHPTLPEFYEFREAADNRMNGTQGIARLVVSVSYICTICRPFRAASCRPPVPGSER